MKEYQNFTNKKYGNKEDMLFDNEINKMKKELENIDKNKKELLKRLDVLIDRQLDADKDSIKYNRIEQMTSDIEKEIEKIETFRD